jgi:molybdenum cofactor cytidylyltransferase
MPDFRCAAVILAAGASTRLGRPKQLILLDGESLLHRTARLAHRGRLLTRLRCPWIRSGSDARQLDGLPVEIVDQSSVARGHGVVAALRHGGALPDPARVQRVLVLVCDQPRLSRDHLRDLLARHQSNRPAGIAITASAMRDRAGVPAVFSASLFPRSSPAPAISGARNVIRAHAAEVESVPWPAGELDLDLPEDLTAIDAVILVFRTQK